MFVEKERVNYEDLVMIKKGTLLAVKMMDKDEKYFWGYVMVLDDPKYGVYKVMSCADNIEMSLLYSQLYKI